MDVADRCAMLEAENQSLRDQIEALEGAMGFTTPMPVEWCLTGSEARVVGVLLAREMCTKDAIMAALYRDHGKDEPEIKIVDVFICKIRRKLKPFQIEITTIWGHGYTMPTASKEVARAAIASWAP